MAEDFKALVAAQKETSKLIQQQIRQSMTAEERDAADTADQARSEAARRGWETRQENNALVAAESAATTAGKDEAKGQEQLTIFQKLGKFLRAGGAAEEEDNSKKKIKDDKQLSFLGKISKKLGDGFKDTKEKAGKGLMGMLKAGLFGGLILAGIAFLNSPYFKIMIKVIKEDIIPAIGRFAKFVGKNLKSFFYLLGDFGKNLMKGDFLEIAKNPTQLLAALGALGGVLGVLYMYFKGGKIAKLASLLTGLGGKAIKGVGSVLGIGKKKGLASVAESVVGGGDKAARGRPRGGGGGKIAAVAKNIAKVGVSAGKGIGGFIGGILKGIASGLASIAAPPVLIGLAAVVLAINGIALAIRIMTPAFEPIGKMMKSFGASVREVFGGLGDFVKDIGKTIEGIITKMGASIGAVIDKISGLQTAGTDATTKQIKELSAIPSDGMFSAAKGINAMKAALDGFGGGTLSKIGDSLFGSGGPIEKIIALTKKVPELMKAAEAITVLGAAGSDFAKTEAELKRRKKVAELKKDIVDGPSLLGDSKETIAKKQAELAALEGQAMKMNAVGSGGTSGVGLKRIEKLVTEIVMMKREQQKNSSAGNNIAIGGDTNVSPKKMVVTQPTPIANTHKSSAMAAAGA